MNILFRHIKGAPVYIAINYQAGGMFQPVGQYGIAHLSEHLLAASSDKYPETIAAQTTYRFVSFFSQVLLSDNTAVSHNISDIFNRIQSYTTTLASIHHEYSAIQSELANFSHDYPNTNSVVLHDYLFSGQEPIKNHEIISGGFQFPTKATTDSINDYIKTYFSQPYSIIVTGDYDQQDLDRFVSSMIPTHQLEQTKPAVVKKNIQLIDPNKNSSIQETYVGIGWSAIDLEQKQIILLLICMRTLANPDNGLYTLLRHQHELIYSWVADDSYANNQLNISLHTSHSSENSNEIIHLIDSYLMDDASLTNDISRQLVFERELFSSMTDGSKASYSNMFYLSQYDLTLESYQSILQSITESELLDAAKQYLTQNNKVVVIS